MTHSLPEHHVNVSVNVLDQYIPEGRATCYHLDSLAVLDIGPFYQCPQQSQILLGLVTKQVPTADHEMHDL